MLFALSAANVVAVGTFLNRDTTMYPGVRIGDLDVSGLTIEESHHLIHSRVAPQIPTFDNLIVSWGNREWRINPAIIDLAIDEQQTAEAAFLRPRQGNLLKRFFSLHQTTDIEPIISLNEQKTHQLLEEWAKEIDSEAKSASVSMDHQGKIAIFPSKPGYKVNLADSLQAIKAAYESGQQSTSLVVSEVAPRVQQADLEHINGIIAEYRSLFNPSDALRTKNIVLAAKSLNRTLLRPGDILSFNSLVGPRTKDKGYEKAPAYMNSELVQDWGGGVCQVSSTLYNAALMADLEIIERSAHYRPPEYVPIGLDATVDFDSNLDFRIKNNQSDSIYVSIEIHENTLIVRLFGKVPENRPEVKLITTSLITTEPKTQIIQDHNLDSGKKVIKREGQKGFIVSVERVRIVNGQELSRELIADDTYQPVDQIILVGTKIQGKSK